MENINLSLIIDEIKEKLRHLKINTSDIGNGVIDDVRIGAKIDAYSDILSILTDNSCVCDDSEEKTEEESESEIYYYLFFINGSNTDDFIVESNSAIQCHSLRRYNILLSTYEKRSNELCSERLPSIGNFKIKYRIINIDDNLTIDKL